MKEEIGSQKRFFAEALLALCDEEERKMLFEKHVNEEEKKILQKMIERKMLYSNAPERFIKTDLIKTGTRLTLLGQVPFAKRGSEVSLKGKVIFREIPAFAFRAWKNAYEAKDFWKRHGFDYVPIEPIISVHETHAPQNQKPIDSILGRSQKFSVTHFARVACGVIDGTSLHFWNYWNGPYAGYLLDQKQKIISVLKEMGIDHGHPHTGNFIVSCKRDEDGNILLEKLPKLYLIDFDAARSYTK